MRGVCAGSGLTVTTAGVLVEEQPNAFETVKVKLADCAVETLCVVAPLDQL